MFYDPETGLDIDGAWIDMNEPSSVRDCLFSAGGDNFLTCSLQFCPYPCNDPWSIAREQDLPPARTTVPPDPNAPIFVNSSDSAAVASSALDRRVDHKGDDVLEPPYAIQNAAGALSDLTAWVGHSYLLRLSGRLTLSSVKCCACKRSH